MALAGGQASLQGLLLDPLGEGREGGNWEWNYGSAGRRGEGGAAQQTSMHNDGYSGLWTLACIPTHAGPLILKVMTP